MSFTNWEPSHYLILAYTVGIIVLWGYATMLLMESRTVGRRERQQDSQA